MTASSVASTLGTSCTYAERVAFPGEVLAEDEQVVLHLHPHARVAVRPIAVLVLCLAVTIMAWVMLPANTGGLIGVCVVGGVALVAGVARGAYPLLVWRSTHYVLTDERILLRDGVVARAVRDLPFNRINDYGARQSVLDRLCGSGTLTVDSIGERSAVLTALPRVQEVQSTLYELIETDRELRPEDYEEAEEEPEEIVRPRGWRMPGRRRTPASGS